MCAQQQHTFFHTVMLMCAGRIVERPVGQRDGERSVSELFMDVDSL